MISYRGKGFNRAAPKNKQAIEALRRRGPHQGQARLAGPRVRARLGDARARRRLAEALPERRRVRADRRRSAGRVAREDGHPLRRAAAPVPARQDRRHRAPLRARARSSAPRTRRAPRRRSSAAASGIEPLRVAPRPPAIAADADGRAGRRGPRKWLRSATSIFSSRGEHGVGHRRRGIRRAPARRRCRSRAQRGKKFDAPVPLSEFAKRGKTPAGATDGRRHRRPPQHTGHGRRDQLSAGERTRILRMLRDEGGRLADEDSQVYIGARAGAKDYDFDFDDGRRRARAAEPAMLRPDVPAKPAVVVGIAQAQAQQEAEPAAAARRRRAPRRAAAGVRARRAPPPPVPRRGPVRASAHARARVAPRRCRRRSATSRRVRSTTTS